MDCCLKNTVYRVMRLCVLLAVWQHAAAPAFCAAQQAPLLTSTWSQIAPYNRYAPDETLAGCTAVAAAQIMRYWQHPPRGSGSHAYEWSGWSLRADFEHVYTWSRMTDTLASETVTGEQIDAVARLLSDVGIAMDMQYGTDWSDADLPDAYRILPLYFAYRPPQLIYRSDYATAVDWYAELMHELDAGRPVLYSLRIDEDTGHAVVVDGYNVFDDMPRFHINMGWGGREDGFYNLEEVVAGGESYNDIEGQHALVGIVPEDEGLWLAPSAAPEQMCADNRTLRRILFEQDGCIDHLAFEHSAGQAEELQAGIFALLDNETGYAVAAVGGVFERTGWNLTTLEQPVCATQGESLYICVPEEMGCQARFVDGSTYESSFPSCSLLIAEPGSGKAPLEVAFACDDAAPDGFSYAWDFDGDGTVDYTTDTASARWIYESPGRYPALVLIHGDNASMVTVCGPVTVEALENAAPRISSFEADSVAGTAPHAVQFACTATDPDGTILEYHWDFDGDNATDAITAGGSAAHTYLVPGMYTARVRAADDSGSADEALITIDVLPASCRVEGLCRRYPGLLARLRAVRDRLLLKSPAGRLLVNWYYGCALFFIPAHVQSNIGLTIDGGRHGENN